MTERKRLYDGPMNQPRCELCWTASPIKKYSIIKSQVAQALLRPLETYFEKDEVMVCEDCAELMETYRKLKKPIDQKPMTGL